LHAIGKPFDLHYSAPSRAAAPFIDLLAQTPWSDRVHIHLSAENTRADMTGLIARAAKGTHVYTCGPDAFMQAVMDAGAASDLPDEALHLEYFAPPAQPEYVNHPFTLRLKDGRDIFVAADQSASDALIAADIKLDIKCADGICGVCKCKLLSGKTEHRDFVLSAQQRETEIILCQSRAADPNGVLEIEL
jgi:ferredoxin